MISFLHLVYHVYSLLPLSSTFLLSLQLIPHLCLWFHCIAHYSSGVYVVTGWTYLLETKRAHCLITAESNDGPCLIIHEFPIVHQKGLGPSGVPAYTMIVCCLLSLWTWVTSLSILFCQFHPLT